MKQGGRPRREDEKPDSPFGKALKEHLRRVEDFTQTDLARETGIPEKTLSHMVKGRRTSGTTLRRDLRDIIRVLYQKKVLLTLEEANRLITKIPAVKELDERDPDDAKIIVLLQTSESEAEQASNQDNGETVDAYLNDSSKSGDGTPLFNEAQEPNVMQVADRVQGPTIILPHTDTPAPLETPVRPTQQHIKRWHIISVLAALVVILAVVFTIASFWQKANGCSYDTNGVTFYTDINYQGQCHTLGPGNYELALYGLDQKVSSIKNWHNAYHVKLFDKDKNFYNLDTDMPVLPAEWDNRADTVLIEKHRPTTCSPGTNGIIAFINPDYSGGCLFITNNIPDLIRFNFDSVIVSIQFIGSYQNTRQLVIYRQPDYKDKCGAYWQDQSDLLQCARLALSVQVLPFTPPTPIPNASGTRFAGNIAPQATLFPGGSGAVVDGNLHTEWVAGHMAELDLSWAFPVTIYRVVVWDRKQSASDNNQINKVKLAFSDRTATGSIDMVSQGPRCADVTFPEKTITWLHIIPVDASGNNGYSEVEVWANTGIQYSNNTCVNKVTVPETIPQVATT